MKRVLINVGKWLVGIVASTIITGIMTGQPLTGLVRLGGLYKTFIKSSVPAWAFAIVFLVGIFGVYYAVAHLPKRCPKGKVHFIADAHNCGWAKQTDTHMYAQIGGSFTYDSPSELVILKAFLKGTEPTTDLMVQIEAADRSGRMVRASELWLHGGISQRTLMGMHLKPVLGSPGKPLRRKLVLIDKFSRSFQVGPINFPYVGPRV